MRRRNLLAVSLPLLLAISTTACVATGPSEVSGHETSTEDQSFAEGDRAKAAAITCPQASEPLQPLTAPPEMPIFEQFNFQPVAISASVDTVVVETPYYTFFKCQEGSNRQNNRQTNKRDRTWSITNTPAQPQAPFDYAAALKSWANPAYEAIEFKGQSYQYRIRLQADWLNEAIQTEVEASGPASAANGAAVIPKDASGALTSKETDEEAVYFDLKTPDGKVTSHSLYTLTDVRASGIGASLGVPRIADIVVTSDTIWLAATTSQGEGENGFASLLRYRPESGAFTVQQPSEIQGDQITSMVATPTASSGESDNLTLWLGTMQSGEGNPSFPASGLVAYQPQTETLTSYTISNSPIVGAIPYQLAVADNSLWVATGNGICQVDWQAIDQAKSWDCWRFAATANLPDQGTSLYASFLAEEPVVALKGSQIEVLWAALEDANQPKAEYPGAFRYEVLYRPGFEVTLAQGGYRINNEVARKIAGGEAIFWPGQQWHWSGKRFERALDEVSWNLVGGGPQGLVGSNISSGFSFDHYAIRGDFDLLSLEPEGTRVRYYSGWVEGDELVVYPKIVAVESLPDTQPNPLAAIARNLPSLGP